MNHFLLSIVFISLSTLTNAASINFNFTGFKGLEETNDGLFYVNLSPTDDGKLSLSTSNSVEEIIDIKILRDDLPTDGDLQLDLGGGRIFSIGSGFNPNGLTHYYYIDNKRTIELKPSVYTKIF